MRWLSRLISVAVVIIIVAGGALLIRSKVPNPKIGQDFYTSAKFRDASRLQVGSPVIIAGVRVGDISRLTLEGRFARVEMRLVNGLELPVDSFATRRADSLFGDSYIEIIPGAGAEGAGTRVMLRSGEPITHVEEGGSTDTTLRAMARTMPKLDEALATLHSGTLTARKWVNGPMVQNVERANSWLSDGAVEDPLSSADRALARLEAGSTAAADAVATAAPGIRATLNRVDTGIVAARTQMKDVREGITTGLRSAREGFDRVDDTIDQMHDVMSAIDEGRGEDWKGTLGRLVNDPELANTLEDATEAGAEGAATFTRFKSWIGGRFEVSALTGAARVYATAEIRTRTDKFYLVEFEKSDLGGLPSDSLSEVAGSADYTRRQEIKDQLRFTAQFGKRFGFLQLRGGIKDSTPGVGADAMFMRGRLRLSADVFGSFDRTPHVKASAAFAVFRTLYVLAGVDDVLNAPGELSIRTGNSPVPTDLDQVHYGRDLFVGAALHFDDADLTTIIRVYGALIGGLLLTQ
jgi:phospholipid/cholesterol/gamma-HCH transport system substrate-binding protein